MYFPKWEKGATSMLHRQQADLAKFKRLMLHSALVALCAVDLVGYFAVRARLDATVAPEVELADANAGARYAPSQPPTASFALPPEPAQIGSIGDKFAEHSAPVPDDSTPIAQLAVIEPQELPAASAKAFSHRERQQAFRSPAVERAINLPLKPRAAIPEHHSAAGRTTARAVALEFARAFPSHFTTPASVIVPEVANGQGSVDLAISAELGDSAEVLAAPVAHDLIEPERHDEVARGTELPAEKNVAQQNSSAGAPNPRPSDIGVNVPVDQPVAAISQADRKAIEAIPVVPRLALTKAASFHSRVHHTTKRLSAAQPLAALSGKRASVPGVAATAETRRKVSLVKPHRAAAPRAVIATSLSAVLVAAGPSQDDHIAVRLGDLLDAFELAMDRAEFERMSRSPNTAELVTLATLRGAGIPVRYDAAERTVAAANGVTIGTATLG